MCCDWVCVFLSLHSLTEDVDKPYEVIIGLERESETDTEERNYTRRTVGVGII